MAETTTELEELYHKATVKMADPAEVRDFFEKAAAVKDYYSESGGTEEPPLCRKSIYFNPENPEESPNVCKCKRCPKGCGYRISAYYEVKGFLKKNNKSTDPEIVFGLIFAAMVKVAEQNPKIAKYTSQEFRQMLLPQKTL